MLQGRMKRLARLLNTIDRTIDKLTGDQGPVKVSARQLR
jgi:hypothetical protein